MEDKFRIKPGRGHHSGAASVDQWRDRGGELPRVRRASYELNTAQGQQMRIKRLAKQRCPA
ncbi:hypothetical protein [Kribbella sp. NPDC006257]|uniref:hypothetical protein n=1 Tax=Kribbella sp. NPDC006257 TaxID=3156738 RepID=UPI0033B3C287